jgi:hypothetical protein
MSNDSRRGRPVRCLGAIRHRQDHCGRAARSGRPGPGPVPFLHRPGRFGRGNGTA